MSKEYILGKAGDNRENNLLKFQKSENEQGQPKKKKEIQDKTKTLYKFWPKRKLPSHIIPNCN